MTTRRVRKVSSVTFLQLEERRFLRIAREHAESIRELSDCLEEEDMDREAGKRPKLGNVIRVTFGKPKPKELSVDAWLDLVDRLLQLTPEDFESAVFAVRLHERLNKPEPPTPTQTLHRPPRKTKSS